MAFLTCNSKTPNQALGKYMWWQDTFFHSNPGIQPYDYDKDFVLFNCDCRDLLPHMKRYDILATDFPYGMDYQGNHRKVKFDKVAGDEKADYDTLRTLIEMADSAAYTFCRWDNLQEFPADLKPKSFLTWVKNNHGTGDLEHEYGRKTESIAFWAKALHKWRNGRPVDVIARDRVAATSMIHPTEKPSSLWTEILTHSVGTTVFEPYGGSCSTVVAAKQLGLKCIACEIVEDYCAKGAARLKQSYLL